MQLLGKMSFQFIQSFLLGLLQGLSEFLPISSSGHLALTQFFFHTDHIFLFTVFAHFGTLTALVVFYRRDLIDILQNISAPPKTNLFLKLAAASAPALLVGFFLYKTIKDIFHQPFFIAFGFLLTSFLLLGTRWKTNEKVSEDLKQISYKQAFIVGCVQVLALLPGVSRSGVTICTGIYLGWPPLLSINFSFLLAVVPLLGAFILELSKINFGNAPLIQALICLISSGLFSWLALHLMKPLSSHLYKFSFYLVPLGLGVLFYTLLF